MGQVTLTCTCGNELTPETTDGLQWYDGSIRCDCGAWYICSVTDIGSSDH